MGMFSRIFEPVIAELDAAEEKLAEREKQVKDFTIALEERSKELDAREDKVLRREQEVDGIRQLAANRKAEVLAAQDQANKANDARKKAEAELRIQIQNNLKLREALRAVLPERPEELVVSNVEAK